MSLWSRYTVLIAVFALFSLSAEAARNELETMLDGFSTCRVRDVYIDIGKTEPEHPFFSRHKLSPYKTEGGFAYFRLKGFTYHGLPVTEIMIPASTWGIITVTIDVPLAKARSQLRKVFGSEFRKSEATEDGNAPELIKDQSMPSRSILVCTNPS